LFDGTTTEQAIALLENLTSMRRRRTVDLDYAS